LINEQILKLFIFIKKNDFLGKPTNPVRPFTQHGSDTIGSPFLGNSSYKVGLKKASL
jgi:hypothetical protein